MTSKRRILVEARAFNSFSLHFNMAQEKRAFSFLIFSFFVNLVVVACVFVAVKNALLLVLWVFCGFFGDWSLRISYI